MLNRIVNRSAALLFLPLAACLADVADVEDTARIARLGSAGPDLTTSELVGEAAEDVTRADCYDSWHHNLQLCKSVPANLQPECWAACSALLVACLALADG